MEFDKNLGYYLRKQFSMGFTIILAVISLFLVLSFIVQFVWNINQNRIVRILVTKLLSLSHKSMSNQFKKPKQPFSKLATQTMGKSLKSYGQKSEKSLQIYEESSGKILCSDGVFDQVLKGSSLNGYTKEISPYLNAKYGKIQNLLKIAQSIQAMSVYQPFLILCILIFNFNEVILVVSAEPKDQNTVSQEQQNISFTKYNGQYYVAIAMIAVSCIIYLVVNASNLFITFINHCQLKKNNKSPQSNQSVNAENQIPTVSPQKKIRVQSDKKKENQQKENQQKERIKQIKQQKSVQKMSFKLRNSLNLVHLLHLVPLFISMGIIIYLRF